MDRRRHGQGEKGKDTLFGKLPVAEDLSDLALDIEEPLESTLQEEGVEGHETLSIE